MNAENIHGSAAPRRRPTNTAGMSIRNPFASGLGIPKLVATRPTSVTNDAKRLTEAITADAIAIPFVIAFVVFPTASNSSKTCLDSLSIPVISAIP